MKTIRIQKLVLENFKKFEHLELVFDGDSTHLYGRNEIGKTTIIDSFFWCLFNKNSQGDSKFSVKPIVNGEEKHHLTTRVEVELLIDGVSKRFAKELQELWTKKRGSVEQVFSGHTCNYFVNDIAKTEREYKATIEEIVKEADFKLLTNVYAFTSLKWEEQREVLTKLVNVNFNDTDLLVKIPELKFLYEQLTKSGATLQELGAKAKRDKKLANDVLEKTPVEIATLQNRKFDIPEGYTEKDVESAISEYQSELSKVVNSGTKSSKLSELMERNSKVGDLILAKRRELSRLELDAKLNKDTLIRIKEQELEELESAISRIDDSIKDKEYKITKLNADIEDLYTKYDEVEALEFDEKEEYCKLCGQKLPLDKIDELKAIFNNNKAEELEKIVESGKKQKAIVVELENDIKSQTECRSEKATKLDEAKATLEEYKAQELEVEGKAELESDLKNLEDELEALDHEIEKESEKQADILNDEKVQELNDLIANAQRILTEMKLKARDEEEIRTKEDLIETNTKLYEDAFTIETQIEQFEKIKAKTIEGQVNNSFEYVSFKLFEEQINGGVKPTCQITVKGVPYADVNNAGKIHAGLDVIRKLQDKLGIQAPIFMDNCECLSSWVIDMKGTQMIRFFVAKNDGIEIERVVE